MRDISPEHSYLTPNCGQGTLDQASSACYYLVSEIQWPCSNTSHKIRNRHVNIVVVGACSEAWSLVYRDKHKDIPNESSHADYCHYCCEEYRNTCVLTRIALIEYVSGVVHCVGFLFPLKSR